jgi:hypothetical protein
VGFAYKCTFTSPLLHVVEPTYYACQTTATALVEVGPIWITYAAAWCARRSLQLVSGFGFVFSWRGKGSTDQECDDGEDAHGDWVS